LADKLNFELVSPERQLASEACDMVVVPGEEGDLGILVEHAPVVTLLRPGVVAVYQGDKVEKRFFVVGGFAEVNENGCILLTEEGFDLAETSTEAAERRLDTARRDFDDVTDEGPARERAAKAVRVAEALVEAAGA
jgi:F-type H+-transporting ATPase subunit epsilon